MHIAVCDDNIADRKQMQRLLERASDQNKKDGLEGFFIDLYGNIPSLMQTPQMYDGIFIDMTNIEESGMNGIEVARELRQINITGRIILCTSSIDYEELATDEEKELFIFMHKPILKNELRKVLDICEDCRSKKEPLIELRDDNGTLYVNGNDILYAHCQNGGGRIEIKLVDGRSITILSTIYMFYEDLEPFYYLLPASESTIINIRHIQKTNAFSVIMDDGSKFRLSMEFNKHIKEQLQAELEKNSQKTDS
jgi:DNA-binding LytR/AlgR family response regulator